MADTRFAFKLAETHLQLPWRFTPRFILRPAADRHDMAASQNVRPSKRQL